MIATVVIAALIVIGLLSLLSVTAHLYQKVGPNRALIVYGRGGTKVLVGGGTLVLPLFQSAQEFNLELMSFDVAPQFDLYTNQGIPVKIEAVTQLKVENENEKIIRAANQFLSKKQDEREGMIRQVMEGHLRGIVGQLTVEQLVKDPEMVSARMRDTVASDLDKLGLEVVSFTLKDVVDDSGYIANMSRPEIAQRKKAAEIAEAEAERDVAKARAFTARESAEAQAEADQARVLAQTRSQAAQAEAQRDLDLRRAEFQKSTAAAQAQAEMSGKIAQAAAQKELVEQQTAVELLQAQRQKEVQAAEAERKAAELVAEVQRPAEARATAARVQAEGEAHATRARAQAEAEASRVRGEAQATADAAKIRETGNAEAETLRAKGLAEAEALQHQVAAQNQAQEVSLAARMIDMMPSLAQALSDAYSKVGSITYVANGDEQGVTGRIGQDIAGMIPVLGGMIQSVTGRSLAEMFKSDASVQSNGHTPELPAPPATRDLIGANGESQEPEDSST